MRRLQGTHRVDPAYCVSHFLLWSCKPPTWVLSGAARVMALLWGKYSSQQVSLFACVHYNLTLN